MRPCAFECLQTTMENPAFGRALGPSLQGEISSAGCGSSGASSNAIREESETSPRPLPSPCFRLKHPHHCSAQPSAWGSNLADVYSTVSVYLGMYTSISRTNGCFLDVELADFGVARASAKCYFPLAVPAALVLEVGYLLSGNDRSVPKGGIDLTRF